MPATLEDLEPRERAAVHGLLGGADPDDLAWAMDETPERVVELAHEALVSLDPRLAEPLGPGDRDRVADYMLLQQSPGQAAGTWDLLESSADARRWALWIRECLGGVYADEVPPIPKVDDGADGPVQRSRGGRPRREGRLEARRRERARRREVKELERAAMEMQSPFRAEALDAYREGTESIKLPHFAKKPTRYAAWGLLGLCVVGLVLAALVKVPRFEDGKVLVVRVPEGAAGHVRGLAMVGLFSPHARDELRTGQELSVRLPDTGKRVKVRLRWVAPRVLSPHAIARRFELATADANRVRGPAAVAVAGLRTPKGAPPRISFVGAVAQDADVQTGSRRVISLVAP